MPVPDRLTATLADRYRIERELRQGGMATVYLAQDLKHDRQVAITVLKPELTAVLGADQFVQEIKTTAQLQHPRILPLFDCGEAGGFLYYVMPYLEGEIRFTLSTSADGTVTSQLYERPLDQDHAPGDRPATGAMFIELLTSGPGAAAPPLSVNAKSVAVLPLASLSPDPDNEYFADGVTEEIINALRGSRAFRWPHVRRVSRTERGAQAL